MVYVITPGEDFCNSHHRFPELVAHIVKGLSGKSRILAMKLPKPTSIGSYFQPQPAALGFLCQVNKALHFQF